MIDDDLLKESARGWHVNDINRHPFFICGIGVTGVAGFGICLVEEKLLRVGRRKRGECVSPEAEEIRKKACAGGRKTSPRKHEERMQYMFMSFMQQICQPRAVSPHATPSASHHQSSSTSHMPYYGPGTFTISPSGGPPYPPSSSTMPPYSSFEDQ